MKHLKSGFTLIEIIIAVAIIGLLAGLGSLATLKAINSSRVKVAKTELELISSAVLQMAWDTGKWPNGSWRNEEAGEGNEVENLIGSALFEISNADEYPNWKGPYYEGSTADPWGQPYFFDSGYRIRGANRVVVGSGGPNQSGINRYDGDNIVVMLDD